MSETAFAPMSIIQNAIEHIPPEIRREVADIMSDARASAGPRLADKLAETPPEERTWGDGVEAAVWGATDFWDGRLTAGLPHSDEGMRKDRDGDVGYVKPQQKRLARNGEVPPIHYRLKVAREHTMKAVRWWGERNGKSLKSLQSGRAKTVAEMAELTVAHSPLSQNEELMRWGASIGTGLSITSLIETIFQTMGKDEEKNVTTARNSTARQVSAGPFGSLAELIDEKAPGITPSHVTKIGKAMVEGASVLAVTKPDRAAIATTIYTVGSLFDSFDGSLARKKGMDGIEGMIEDVQADLEQQIVTLGALSVVAMRRGNKVAAANYALAAMLTPLSALTRAQAESRGFVVPEGGTGTRVGRGILAGVGMGLNKYRDASDIVSAMLATGVANTVLQRRGVVKKGADSNYYVGINHDPEFMEEASIRKQAIQPWAEAGLAIGGLLMAANSLDSVHDHMPKAKAAA